MPPLPGNLTVYQNLRFFGMMYAVKQLRDRIEALLEQFDLQRFRDVKCGVLSSGEQTRVGLAKALINDPQLLAAGRADGIARFGDGPRYSGPYSREHRARHGGGAVDLAQYVRSGRSLRSRAVSFAREDSAGRRS